MSFLNKLMVNLLNMDSILEIKNNFLMEHEQQQESDIEDIQNDFIKESNTREISQKTLRKIKNHSKSKNIPINFEEEVRDKIKNNYLSKITPPLSKTPESGIRSFTDSNETSESGIRSFTDSNETSESGIQLPENSLTVSESGIRSFTDSNETSESGIRSFTDSNETSESGIRSFTDSNETSESGIQLPENSLTVSDFLSNKPKIISIKQIENYLNKKISGKIETISSNPRYYVPSNKTKKDIKNALLFSSIIDPKSSYEVFKIQKKIQQIPAYSEGGLISYGQSGETNLGLVGEIQPEQISSTTHGIEVNPTTNNRANSLGIISDPSIVIANQQGIKSTHNTNRSSIKTKYFDTQQIEVGDGGFISQKQKIDLIEELKTIFVEIPSIQPAELPGEPNISFSKNEPFPIEFSNIRNINSMISNLFTSRAFRNI